jgi:hypothetical protein
LNLVVRLNNLTASPTLPSASGRSHPSASGRSHPSASGRSDAELAKAWHSFCASSALDDDDRGRLRLVYDGVKSFFYYDSEAGLWRKSAERQASNHLLAAMETAADGAFWSALSPTEQHYVGMARGGLDVLSRLLWYIEDRGFEARLDTKQSLLAFDNGVLDLDVMPPQSPFRPLGWEDYVTRTIGYCYVPRDLVP